LAIFGRAAFWPFMPKPGKKKLAPVDANTLPGLEGVRGLWKGVGNLVGKRPRTTWIVTLLLLLAAIAGLPGLKASGIPQTEFLLGDNIESVDGQEVLAEHFDAGDGSPIVIIADEANYAAVITAAEGTEGITKVTVQPDAEAMAAAYTAAIEKAAAEAAAAMAASGAAGGMTGPPLRRHDW
jgi:RND superfamily putative drug exporter